MDTLARPLIGLYQLSNGILATSLQDLSDHDARVRVRGGNGPSIAWVVGHLCHYKLVVLGLLGQPRDNALEARFERTPASDGADYPSLAELAQTFAALNTDLCAALDTAASQLEAPMSGGGPHAEKKVLDTVLFLAWHEAYHLGSISAIRKELGRKGIAELVTGQ
ncbi:MAG: DinB family protein [Acidobacteriota bacterium]